MMAFLEGLIGAWSRNCLALSIRDVVMIIEGLAVIVCRDNREAGRVCYCGWVRVGSSADDPLW